MRYLFLLLASLALFGCTTLKATIDPATQMPVVEYKYFMQNKAWSCTVTDKEGKIYAITFGNSNEPFIAALGVAAEAVKRIPIAAP